MARAERAMSQAQGLSEEGNWPAAAAEWRKAADNASLLNDRASEAIALHNLAYAQRHLNDYGSAISNATVAAELNERIGYKDDWWRNQILLLQLEALGTNRSPEARFEKLTPRTQEASDGSIRGAFWNEVGLWQQKRGEFEKASESFARAQADYERAKDSAGVATIIANRARLLEAHRQFDLALRSWIDALSRFERLADPSGITHALAGHGRTLLAMKKELPVAEEQLRRAVRNFRNLKMEAEAHKATKLLVEALLAQDKRTEADALKAQLAAPR